MTRESGVQQQARECKEGLKKSEERADKLQLELSRVRHEAQNGVWLGVQRLRAVEGIQPGANEKVLQLQNAIRILQAPWLLDGC